MEVVGFTHSPGAAEHEPDWASLGAAVGAGRGRVVVYERGNVAKRVVSKLVKERAAILRGDGRKEKCVTNGQLNASDADCVVGRFAADAPTFVYHACGTAALFRKLRSAANATGLPTLRVQYEELQADPAKVARAILDFAGATCDEPCERALDAIRADSTVVGRRGEVLTKTGSEDLRSQVTNYADLLAAAGDLDPCFAAMVEAREPRPNFPCFGDLAFRGCPALGFDHR